MPEMFELPDEPLSDEVSAYNLFQCPYCRSTHTVFEPSTKAPMRQHCLDCDSVIDGDVWTFWDPPPDDKKVFIPIYPNNDGEPLGAFSTLDLAKEEMRKQYAGFEVSFSEAERDDRFACETIHCGDEAVPDFADILIVQLDQPIVGGLWTPS